MPGTFDWDDTEEIGIQLAEKFPDVDPLGVRFTDLHKWVTELDGFTGDPKLSSEGKLESIQMAWLEERNATPVRRLRWLRDLAARASSFLVKPSDFL